MPFTCHPRWFQVLGVRGGGKASLWVLCLLGGREACWEPLCLHLAQRPFLREY